MIVIKSLETSYTGNVPKSKVSFDLCEELGAITHTVASLSLSIDGVFDIHSPELLAQIHLTLAGTTWAANI